MQEFETKLTMSLLGKLPDDQIRLVLSEVQRLQRDYDITARPQELMRPEDAAQFPAALL